VAAEQALARAELAAVLGPARQEEPERLLEEQPAVGQ